jgi:hypothetical protein
MWRLKPLAIGAFAVALAAAGQLAACPFCGTETSQLVRARIFDDQFAWNVASTLATWPVLLVAAGLFHLRVRRR